jgi:plasmid stabilization system protein ParE
MSYHLREVAQVRHDLADHYQFIQRGGQPDAAVRFLRAYHELTERLREWPLSGRAFQTEASDLQDIRICGLPAPFQAFQVFYLPQPEEQVIRILAVLHAAMGPARRSEELFGRSPEGV